MKTNFKNAIMAATALLLGFSSCSSDDESGPKVDNSPKNVTISISAPSTYADEASAVGVMPDVTDVTVFFVGAGIIQEVGTMTTAEVGSAKTFTNVPGATTDVIIVANAATVATDDAINTISQYNPLSKLNELMFVQANQTDPDTAVNLFGSAAITGTSGAYTANVILTPAISRYEIAQVSANPAANIVLDSFDLTGIYINNTYTKLGTDYVTTPAPFGDILNYDATNAIWTNNSYPARFSDEFTTFSGATSYAPTDLWSYYLMPVKASAGEGTTIGGVPQSVIPHIVLKIENATAIGHIIPSLAYVTIKDLKVGATSLTELAPGKVYSIANIAIGGENLSAKPETNASEEISVTATVTVWTEETVTPEF
ncbi:hypothetical protein IR083_03450 [Dysgonomonas sp. GY75]|uniref:hypothetical protein n=1 Tax=Dysgonomonas sp. GY75 TaxID=2780419 RepID=UPI0018843300|nr:hypothetical protein [Dysgonomonas sp. GY75]MBF0647873.1 hypothetical protein [Dysgonomonas sp. GY75]